VFQLVPQVTAPGMAPPTVGWISAVAAYGSFIVPAIFRIQVDAGTPQTALYLFTGFYGACLVLNGLRFARRTQAHTGTV
jgi:NNP family nitrate/nitrite transporter-like MFS transporter